MDSRQQKVVLHLPQVADIPERPLDVLDVFRRPEDLSSHLDDILKAKPKACSCIQCCKPELHERLGRSRGSRLCFGRTGSAPLHAIKETSHCVCHYLS